MNFRFSAILAGLVFGVFGIYLFRFGKKHAHASAMGIGLALMIYPYFIENEYLLWGLGAVLTYLGYRQINS